MRGERKFFYNSRSKGVNMKMRCKKAKKQISLALDSRLPADGFQELHAHLHGCPACRNWQKEQQGLLVLMKTAPALPQLSAGFYAALQEKINKPLHSGGDTSFLPFPFRPVLLRAAMFLLLLFSVLAGFVLSGRLDAPGAQAVAADFNQAMNLDAFADLPVGSFGAVYERLLQGGLQ